MDAPYVYVDRDPLVANPLDDAEDAQKDATVWVFPTIGLGGGSSRLGPIVATAGLDAHAFLTPALSLGVRGSVLSAGEPDGNGDATRELVGFVGWRWKLTTSPAHEGFSTKTTWLHLAAGVGWMGLHGYTGRAAGRRDYDLSSVVLDGRASALWTYGVFLTAIGLDVVGAPGQGLAIVPNIGVGIGF